MSVQNGTDPSSSELFQQTMIPSCCSFSVTVSPHPFSEIHFWRLRDDGVLGSENTALVEAVRRDGAFRASAGILNAMLAGVVFWLFAGLDTSVPDRLYAAGQFSKTAAV